MTPRAEKLHDFFRMYGNRFELWQALERRDELSYSLTQAVSELRDYLKEKGLTIRCTKHKPATKNVYEIVALGQMELFVRAGEE